MTQSLLPQNGMWAYSTATITQCRSGTRNFFGNLIIVVWGIRHGRYYLKMGCEHTAWPLSPTVNANLELLWALDNCDARRMTRSLLPQDGMWAYGTSAITHYRMRAYSMETITHCRMRAYGMAAITHYSMYKILPSLWEHVLDIDLHDMFRKSVSSSALPFTYGHTTDVRISCYFV